MKLRQWFFVGILLSVFVMLSYLSASQESLTYDEIVYTQEGRAIFSGGNFSIDPYNPPFIKEILHFGGRNTTIVLGYLLLLSVFFVTKSYFGVSQAFFALFLLSLEPNILGNSHYVTLDTGFTLFFFLSYIVFLWWISRPSARKSIILGCTLGAVLASKITAIPFFLVSAVVVWLWKKPSHVNRWQILIVCIVSAFMVWGVYFLKNDVIVVKHDNPNRVSSKIISYANNHNIVPLAWAMERLQNQKVPLGTYMSVVKNNIIRGRSTAGPEPWYLMLINFFLKTPLPLLFFFVVGLRKRNLKFLIPIGVILFVSVVSRMNAWVRYLLPLYPFLAITASTSIKEFRGVYGKLILIGLIIWYALGTAVQFPHFIAYANELAGPREKRYEKFVDSNIDWGESLPDLEKYVLKKQPRQLKFSYFGRDNADLYGFRSDLPWGSYKFEEICAFHTINYANYEGRMITAISISNWYGCGYSKQQSFDKKKIIDVVGDSILIFP